MYIKTNRTNMSCRSNDELRLAIQSLSKCSRIQVKIIKEQNREIIRLKNELRKANRKLKGGDKNE